MLTVGDSTYIEDSRVAVVRPVLSMVIINFANLSSMFVIFIENWSLQIRGVTLSDGGEYLCQTSQHPPENILVHLTVYGKKIYSS